MANSRQPLALSLHPQPHEPVSTSAFDKSFLSSRFVAASAISQAAVLLFCTENHRASFSMPHLPVRWCLLLGSVANLPRSFLRARPSPQNPNNVRLPTVHRPLRRGHVRTVGARQASARNLRFRFRFSDVRADSQTFRDCCLKTRSQTWRAKFKISFRNLRHRFGISDRVSKSQT